MTWNLNVSGHSDNPDEEADNIGEARRLLGDSDFNGMVSASFSGMHTGSTNLLEDSEGGE